MSDQITPTLTTVMSQAIDSVLTNIHTAMPGQIVSYDYEKNLATVKCAFKRKYKTATEATDLPLLVGVPVHFPRTATSQMRFPLAKDDWGLLIFNERSIDNWFVLGKPTDPEDARKFALADAVFLPGLFPQNKAMESVTAQGSIEIKNNEAYIELLPTGKFKIANPRNELIDSLVKLVDNLIGALVITGIGSQPFLATTIADFNARKAELEDLKG